ncbi:PD-(D/E)XK nuclease family protein [Nitrosophilus alvini]|uniref:PD-(D/E)XK nuclease family protein n=1 Tax=Nitrosophilus alvini TaxID=2714855 RepID=UPI00190D4B77|nr:PD-(D/E)XK nuclease family protein [Nitrosophilus alvini]
MLIFPTVRAIRQERARLQAKGNVFLPKMVTIDEFIKRSVIVPGKKAVDEDTRVILLGRAADFDDFKKLKIERDFFKFLKNSDFFFRFFEELSVEKVDISSLYITDIYAEYSEHLDILQELKRRYEKLLEEYSFFDRFQIPSLYRLNRNFIGQIEYVKLYLEGFATNFELELFDSISKERDFFINYTANGFNEKMSQKLEKLGFGTLEVGFSYSLDLTNKEILEKKALNLPKPAEAVSFKNRISQTGFVKKKIYDFVKSGIKPEDIAVILPDENFKEYLYLFDLPRNLNFAMGFDYSSTSTYKKLTLLLEYINDRESIKNQTEIEKESLSEIAENFLQISSKRTGFDEFRKVVEAAVESEAEEREIFEDEIEKFKILFGVMKEYTFAKKLRIFLNRLQKRSIDDVQGGKITVMGLLESRGCSFEGVIIPDFNEGIVPKPSEKDIFLDSKVRRSANLPTRNDRENLQKYYYYELFRKAKKCAVCYVKNDIDSPSRLIEEFGFFEKKSYAEKEIAGTLFSVNTPKKRTNKEIKLYYDFKKEKISATKLKDLLECKRRFYYKYIKNLKSAEMPTKAVAENEVGNILHEALKNVYRKKDAYFSVAELKKEFETEMKKLTDKSNMYMRFLTDIWTKKIEPFCENEIKRFEAGYRVFKTEQYLTASFEGFVLEGKIDRIDSKSGRFYVIDYKSGNIKLPAKYEEEKVVDFQLEFYYLLSLGYGEIEKVCYYDLKDGKLKEEKFFGEKMGLLKETLKSLEKGEVDFSMTQDFKNCRYCPYKIVCGRD